MQSPELFAALTNRSILDQRFATSLSNETISILNDMAKYLRERLAREGDTIKNTARLNKLLSDVNKRLEDIYENINELYIEQFKFLAFDEAEFVAASMQSVVVSDVIVESVSNQRLWDAVTKNPLRVAPSNGYVDFTAMIDDLGDNAKLVANMISGGFASNLTLQEITQSIIGTRAQGYTDGILDKSRRDANRIIRTAVNHIANESRSEVFKQNKNIVYGYTIAATIDTRTSTICRFYDGKTYRYDARAQPMPPFHHNCRTQVYPEMYGESLKDTGATRAVNFKAKDGAKAGKVGQVDAQRQYYDILKQQPAAQQDLVLGKARGLIFRNSGLSAEEFRKALSDSMGRPLTLKEMAEKNAEILRYMQSNSFLREYLGD